MGYVRHSAIVATAWQADAAAALSAYASEIGARPMVSEEVTNGYITVCIPSDGSKEGWQESADGDERRAQIKAWIAAQPNWYFEWCEVAYGDDDSTAAIVAHAWSEGE